MKMTKRKCPECRSTRTVKDGFVLSWSKRRRIVQQRYRCNDCGRLFRESTSA